MQHMGAGGNMIVLLPLPPSPGSLQSGIIPSPALLYSCYPIFLHFDVPALLDSQTSIFLRSYIPERIYSKLSYSCIPIFIHSYIPSNFQIPVLRNIEVSLVYTIFCESKIKNKTISCGHQIFLNTDLR